MKKRVLSMMLLLTMTITITTGCKKETPVVDINNDADIEATNQEGDRESESIGYEKLIIGLDDTFAPLGFRDENNELVGFDIDMAAAVCEELGVEFELQPIDWSMKEAELTNKNIDLIWNGYTITDARKEKVLFTDAYLNNSQVVVVMGDSEIVSLADLEGKTVAAQTNSSAIDAIESKPEIKESFGELVTFDTNNECLMDLEAGRAQAVVADEVLVRYYISQKTDQEYKILIEDFGKEEYGIGARKEDEKLVDAINVAMDTLKENGTMSSISIKWFGEDIVK